MRLFRRVRQTLHPSHQHSAFSATLLLAVAVGLSRLLGYARESYIAYTFGAGSHTDAYVAAFTLPDIVSALLIGGNFTITLTSIYTRYQADNRDVEAQQGLSVIITVMTLVLTVGVVFAEIFTAPLERLLFPHFTEEQLALCVHITRILLPGKYFFYLGGILSAVLYSKRLFLFPAIGPLLYNVCVILGGVCFAGSLGIKSLAVGALVGSFVGPFLFNAWGASRAGVWYSPSINVRTPAFQEWLRISIPLVLTISSARADDWLLRFYASGLGGEITRLHYAKRLLFVPLGIMGLSLGQATIPFFARLYGQGQIQRFEAMVTETIYRIIGFSLLATAWIAACAFPLVELVFRRGRFLSSDAQATALYLTLFSLALAFWTAQILYNRAFYAAGDTFTPMLSANVITALCVPLYWVLFRMFSVAGLPIATGIGVACNSVALALILNRRGLVRAGQLPWKNIAKITVIAGAAAVAGHMTSRWLPAHPGNGANLTKLMLCSLVWAAVAFLGLWSTRSNLLRGLGKPASVPSGAAISGTVRSVGDN